MKSIGLYVHIPFCVKKCNYCDFLSISADEETKEKYVEALVSEIEEKSKRINNKVDTVFIGGGTPYILRAELIYKIADTIQRCFGVEKDAEITIETNPGTLNENKLHIYKESGINRISMGLQSANDNELKMLGRIHNFKEFENNYNAALKKGFENINIDIMSALPGQTVSSYEDTLNKVVRMEPTHISAYSLIIEENTPFYEMYFQDELLRQKGEKPLVLPDENDERKMYEMTGIILSESGYERYEISNYSLKGYECRHNIKYWKRNEYVGFGVGAASLYNNVRYKNISDINEYINKDSFNNYEEKQIVDSESRMEEFMFLGLRMMDGILIEDFRNEFNISIDEVYGDVLRKLVCDGLMVRDEKACRLSNEGINLSNYVLSQMLL